MTRLKKTRSLKRIHNVKTGSISKLKKQAGADRQTGKRVKNRVASVYEKFLAENPDAKAESVKQQQQEAAQPKSKTAAQSKPKPAAAEPEKAPKEKEKSLLEQLESKDFKDIY